MLFIPKGEKLTFQFSVFTSENRKDPEDSNVDFSNKLLGILQDIFYVTSYAIIRYDKESGSPKSELDKRDNNWGIFRWIWYNFTDFLRENFNEIRIPQNSDKSEILSKIEGAGYAQFVREMGQPFMARYNLYVFSLLFWSKNYILKNFGSCTDIICNFRLFMQFWNGILAFLSNSVEDLQVDDEENLKSKFEKILNNPNSKAEYRKFKKNYLKEKGGCFSLTMVDKKDGSRQDVLCFSGLQDYPDDSPIGKAIKKIKVKGGFKNPYVVHVTDYIRYDLICGKYICYGEAKNCKFFSNNREYNRMFSCCERKTIADYDWEDCASYTMIVKYEPCKLCQKAVTKHNKSYNGRVLHGKKDTKTTKVPKLIDEFDRLAKCIFSGPCPLCACSHFRCNAQTI